jgi:hypothetical protein
MRHMRIVVSAVCYRHFRHFQKILACSNNPVGLVCRVCADVGGGRKYGISACGNFGLCCTPQPARNFYCSHHYQEIVLTDDGQVNKPFIGQSALIGLQVVLVSPFEPPFIFNGIDCKIASGV